MREASVKLGESAYAEMGVEELVSLCQDAGPVAMEELECNGNGGLIQVTLQERLDEERLDELPYVYQWEFVAERDDGYLYLLGFVAPELPAGATDPAADLVGTCDPQLDEHGVTMSLVGPQEAIRDTLRAYAAAGVNPDLRHLGAYDGSDDPMSELTDRQREVLETAYEQGYYEVPRDATTEEVAAELDLDPSTVAEHLQRAERNLLTEQLRV